MVTFWLILGGSAGRLPVVIPGDGKCLLYSLFVARTGKLYLVKELRVRMCIEMVVNRENTGVGLIAAIVAAATVLNTRIVSIYPPVNS